MVLGGKAEYLLVPGAYPHVASFIQDENLPMLSTFMCDIPELSYGNLMNDLNAMPETVLYHPATHSLLNKLSFFENPAVEFLPVDSNEVAYTEMVDIGNLTGCISNRLVFDHYDHPVLVKLRNASDMS